MMKTAQILETLKENINESISAKSDFLNNQAEIQSFGEAVQAVNDAYRAGGRIYIAGNGGSAADSQHLAAEFVSKLARDRGPIAAEALTVDTSILTAIGNDYGFEYVFSRQILGKMRANDIFLGITTSGNSKNIIEALKACKTVGAKSIILTGHDGGECKQYADFCIVAAGKRTSTIQEIHILLAHTLCECIENEFLN